ncbi:MAG: hypothetical protein HN725_07160 [Alphaproteobacteria bacterium]|jgi:hypothetical protein|nr:hypothetical protein [Alphaproteobacteria bacterium]MBT4084146.1 hypothetical protein [Alphaproteobacteria bacterium]MBT4546515.1 hypothetical protein [Alphaproteobacteria bacterium]MBT7745056.1 hypothetical protein [Alphaproteobacteria bacterium]
MARIIQITTSVLIALTGISAPAAAQSSARVYGTVETRGHAEVLAKWSASSKVTSTKKIDYAAKSGYGGGSSGNNSEGDAGSSDNVAIDYGEIADIFVILSNRAWQGGTVHEVELSPYGLNVEVLAVARGDIIRLHNKTGNTYTPYLAGTGDDDIQDFDAMKPGSVNDLVVELTGDLELGLDEDEEEIIIIAAGEGWKSSRVASGGNYEFNNLAAGDYGLTFWYWRLGSLDRKLSLKPGQGAEINEVLSVDRIIK